MPPMPPAEHDQDDDCQPNPDLIAQINEMVSPLLEGAIAQYALLVAWMEAGFSRSEAFALLRDVLERNA